MSSSVVTFSRRNRKGSAEEEVSSEQPTPSAVSSYRTAASVLTPVAESPSENVAANSGRGAPAGRWKRRPAQGKRDGLQMSDMRSYFEEVDAFELAVETPTPPAKQHAVPANGQRMWLPSTATRVRPMSLGLSRRSSMAVPPSVYASASKPNHTPLRISITARALADAQEQRGAPEAVPRQSLAHRLSVAADNAGSLAGRRRSSVSHYGMQHRRSSVAPARLSTTGHMLSRLSMGLSDALQWLGVRGSIPTTGGAHAAEAAAVAAAAGVGPQQQQQQQGLSPILASPDVASQEEGHMAAEHGVMARPAAVSPILESPAASPSPLADTAEVCEEAQPAHTAEVSAAAAGAAGAEDAAAEMLASESAHAAAEVEALQEELQAKLTLDDPAAAVLAAKEEEEEEAVEADQLDPLEQLLLLCGQEPIVEALPNMEELLGQHVDLSQVRKIGEGTFGEAFKAGSVVLKIVPMEGDVLVNGEPQKRSEEILAEVAITLALSRLRGEVEGAAATLPTNATAGFVETFGVGVCRGRYATALRKEWHRWDKQNSSENDPVDIFGREQLFVVFVVADGGSDLEHVEFRSFEELRSILTQCALTLAVAEEALQFEHRDLHWGNLLIARQPAGAGADHAAYRLRGVDVTAPLAGVRMTLIDFTLSRLALPEGGEVAFCDLAADPELFKGPKGDTQAETYRRMKKATGNSWEQHAPVTNCLWMHYLADICLAQKLASFACSTVDKVALRGFRKRSLGYTTCGELVFDEFLVGSWTAAA